MSLTVLLCESGSLFGKIIAASEHNPYNHVALDFGDGYAVAEEWCGLWIRTTASYPTTTKRWVLPLNTQQEIVVTQWLKDRIGQGYDYWQIVLDAVTLHTPNTSLRFTSPATKQRAVCSGIIAEAVFAAGWYPFGTLPPASVMPSDWAVAADHAALAVAA